MSDKSFMGMTYVWWQGVVEDRNDPLLLGRARVRILGWHSDNKAAMPTASLPWAHPVIPLGVRDYKAPAEGEWVMGFFRDGEDGQEPVMTGTLPGIPQRVGNPSHGFVDPRTDTQLAASPRCPASVSYETEGDGVVITESGGASRNPARLKESSLPRPARANVADTVLERTQNARVVGVGTAIEGTTWDEPSQGVQGKYPFIRANESESGHVQVVDDTPGNERLVDYHRSGTGNNRLPDGTLIERVVKDKYEIVYGDDHIYIMGDVSISVNGSANIYVKGQADLKVDGDYNETIEGNKSVLVKGNFAETVEGAKNVDVTQNLAVTARRIDLN